MLELIVFIGLPGSGKSTFYRQRFAGTHQLVSKDLLLNNRQPSRRQRQLIEEALASGRSVVVDNTHPAKSDRAQLITLARAVGARVVGYRFDASVAECLARNGKREGKARVPPVAIFVAQKRFELPSYEEGFDELFTVHLDEERGFSVEKLANAASPSG